MLLSCFRLNALCILQSQMEELRQHMGATLSERYTSQQKGTAKMMNDYEQMRKDLAKVTTFDASVFQVTFSVSILFRSYWVEMCACIFTCFFL